jgi:hypothetical protein
MGASKPLLAYEECATSRSELYSPFVRMGIEEAHSQGLMDLAPAGREDCIREGTLISLFHSLYATLLGELTM